MKFILGVSTNHNATACLLKDGEILACASEERFSRLKNQSGIPKKAISFCLDFAKIKPKDLDLVAVADLLSPNIAESSQELNYNSLEKLFVFVEDKLESRFPSLRPLFYKIITLPTKKLSIESQKNRLIYLRKIIPLSRSKFQFVDHHTCHSYSTLFASPYPNLGREVLVFTADGAGDSKSATVGIYKDGKYKLIQEINSQQSLGFFYLHITQYLGLKPIEDEYKVMGLAPYATHKEKVDVVYKKLRSFFKFDTRLAKWEILVNEHLIQKKLPEILNYCRFDHIAAAVQKILEELVTKWVRVNVKKWGIKTLCFSGGVFANVKLNQKISQLPEIKEAFFMPSPGDESNAIGAATFGYTKVISNSQFPISNLKAINNLYLGPEYSEKEILKALKKYPKLKFTKIKNVEIRIARLLARGEVVARFSGRMEFGARALGNRSILAHPSDKDSIEFINSAVKNRDFWMPFAPTILRERVHDNILMHKADSPFMTVAYDTTSKGKKDLVASLHPYDKTTRPQVLDRQSNPKYWELIKNFERITGIGAVLNTSFNLHGEPIVESPEDALRVFNLSQLKYLAIEDFLVEKK